MSFQSRIFKKNQNLKQHDFSIEYLALGLSGLKGVKGLWARAKQQVGPTFLAMSVLLDNTLAMRMSLGLLKI